MNESENFADRLRRWRSRPDLGLEKDQVKAALILGIGRSYLSELENGREPGKFLRQKFDAVEFASAAEIAARLEGRYEEWRRLQSESLATSTRANEASPPLYYKRGGVSGGIRNIPVVGWAQAADLTSLIDFNDSTQWDEEPVETDLRDPKAIAVRIRGDSMEPDYKDGDIVILACSSDPVSGDLIVGRLKTEGPVFKLLQIIDVKAGVYRLSSFNLLYEPIKRNREDFFWLYPVDSMLRKLRR